ncbi:hypothetical protein [Caballeronia grimmiae]|uniref:hypothetical protein n=1 Tax=Caballeronia grimmiae TaxID=1071679 RepID=UPI0038B98D4C
MHRDIPEPNAVDTAIESCSQQIEWQTDRLIRQTRAGKDPAKSRALLFAYHQSLLALKQAKQALEAKEKAT